MVQQISSLRVASDLDASGYTRGAKQIDAANAAMAGSARSAAAAFTDTTARISRSGDALSQLERRFVPGAREAQNFEVSLRRLGQAVEKDASQMGRAVQVLASMQTQFGRTASASELMERGQIGAARVAQQLTMELQSQERAVVKSATAQARLAVANDNASHHASNLAAQFQDIAVSAQMGMSPLQVALQQGTQISAVLGPMGAAGAARALGSAFLGLVNPVSLMTIGLVAASTAAIQYLANLGDKTRSVDDVLTEHEARIRGLKDAYGDAAKGVAAYAAESRKIDEFMSRASQGEMQVKLRAEAQSASGAVADLFGENRGLFGSSAFARRDSPFFDAIKRGLENIRVGAEKGQPAVGAFREEMVRLANANPSPEVDKFVASVLSATDNASKLERALVPTAGALAQIGNAAAASVVGVTSFSAALEKLGSQIPSIAKAQSATGAMRDNVYLYQQALDDLDRQMAQGSIRNEEAYFNKKAQLAEMLRKAQIETSGLGEATRDLEKRERSAYVDAMAPREAAAARIRDRYAEFSKTLKDAGASQTELDRNTASMNAELANSAKHFDEVEAKAKSASNSYKELVRNAGARLDQMRLELELTGKTGAAAEELRYRQQLLADAMADNVQLTPQQVAQIDGLAKAYGRLSEQIKIAQALDDLQFERDQMGRSREEQQVYSEIRRLGVDINSAAGQQVANAIRMNAAIEKQRDMWDDIASTVSSIFTQPLRDVDDLFQRIFSGFAKIGQQNIENLFQGLLSGTGVPGRAAPAGSASAGNLLSQIGDFLGGIFTDKKVIGAQNRAINTASQQIAVKPLVNAMGAVGTAVTKTTGQVQSSITSIMGAVKQIESGGNYNALGPVTKSGDRAYGAYQVMGANIPSWTKQLLGYSVSTQEFLRSRAIQDGVAYQQMKKSYDRFANVTDVFSTWFSGQPLSVARNRSDGYNTTQQYVNKGLSALQNQSQTDITSAVASGTKQGISAIATAGANAGAGMGAAGSISPPGGAGKSGASGGMGFSGFANAALGGLGIGFQSESAGMGGIGGALSGFAAGGLPGLIVGGIAGVIGGLFGASRKRKQEEKQARQQLNQNSAAIAQLFAMGEGRGIGSATQAYQQFYDKTAEIDEVAQKANDSELVKKLRDNVNKFFIVLEKDFVNKLPGIMDAYSAGYGSNSPFMQGAAAMEQLREELKNLVADAKDFGELQLKNKRDLTPEQLAQRVADAERAAQQMVLSTISGVRELGEMETQILSLKGSAATAVTTLEQLGMETEAAAKAVEGSLSVAFAKLKDKYIGDLTASINERSGLGYLNSIMDAQITYQQRMADAAQLGMDGSLALRELSLSIGEIVRQAGLGANEISMLAGAFPDLRFVLNGVSTASMTVAEATSQLQAAYEKEASALSETINAAKQGISAIDAFRKAMKLGSSSPLSPFDKVTEAMKQLRDTADKAAAGDPEAIGKITQVGQNALDEARSYYASSTDYFEIWKEVESIMARVQGATEGQLSKAEQQKKALDASVSGILKVNDSVVSVREAIDNFNQAQKANTDLLATQLALIGKAGTASIEAAYKANLDRATDSSGGAYWQNQIASGKTVDQVVDAIANSREAQINALYKQVFGRPLDNESRAYWVNSGKSIEQITADLQYAKTQGAYARGGIVGAYAAGGRVGNGLYNADSVRARYAGGGDIMLAGGEAVTRATSVNSRTWPTLDWINRTGTVPGNDNSALLAELRGLRQTVETQSAMMAALASALAGNAKQQSETAKKMVAILSDVSSELKLASSR